MLRKTPLASAISSITVASAIGAGGAALPAYAADEMLEEIVVTGSRIKRADLASASPISVVTREEMTLTGNSDIGDLLQSMPSMSGSPIGTTTNNGGNGAVTIDLRGMGAARTLTLVNGHRVVDQGDYQTIPSTMIDRVEILKDGASAVYGADAVAGVVNIITRKDFEGVEVYAQTADWSDAKGAQDVTGVIAGTTFDGGHFVFGAEYVKQEEAYQRDVPWDFMQNSYYIYPEGCEKTLTQPYPTGCFPIGSSRIPQTRASFYSQGTYLVGTASATPYTVGLLAPHDGRTYNYAPVNYLQTPYERTNVFVEGSFEITEDIKFSAEVRGNDRTSAQELAPLPFTGGDPMYDGFYLDPATGTTVSYTGVSENNYYLRAAVDRYNAANAAAIAAGTVTALIYEPLVNPRRRMIETNRRFTQDVKQYQFLAELEGDFNDLNWSVFFSEGYRTRQDVDYGQFSGARLQNALGPSADLDGNGQPECYADVTDPNTLIVGCVPLNLFGGGEVDAGGSVTTATLTPDMINYVSTTLVDSFGTRDRTAGASVSGNAFELPGGPMGWAVGYAYWKQDFYYTPDSAKILGAATGNVGAGTTGSLTNNGYYAEVLAPLMDNGEQSLILDAGVRYDDWDALGGDTTWQLGLEFNVVQDVKLRATAGTVFRAPGIGSLFGGLVDSFPTFTDPCTRTPLPAGCARASVQLDTQVHALVGGNPNVKPETGDTFTTGLVWTPTFGDHNISLTVDYWQISLDDGISSLGVQKILEDCYVDQSAQACALVTRNNDANYSIDTVLDGALNVATQGAKGVDTEVRWNFTTDYGQWQLSFLWSHNMERTKTPFPGAAEEDLVGRYTDPTAADGGAYPENKLNYTVQWAWNDFTVAYKGEFIGQLDADTFCNCGTGNRPDGSYIQDIDSELYHDLVGQWDAPYGFKVSGGITNLTDEAPPYIEVGFNATTDPPAYRLFGRGYYVRVGWEY